MFRNMPPPLTEPPEFDGSKSMDAAALNGNKKLESLRFVPTPPRDSPAPPASACGHNAGQELCYLCHQRERRNVYVSFAEERKKREIEEDRLLQQYQHMKDTEHLLQEQVLTCFYNTPQQYHISLFKRVKSSCR